MKVQIDADLEDLIPGYIDGRHKDIATMQASLASGDYETLRIKGHSMKGSGAGYGFDAITDIGQKIEDAAKIQDNQAISGQVKRLKEYIDGIEIEFV